MKVAFLPAVLCGMILLGCGKDDASSTAQLEAPRSPAEKSDELVERPKPWDNPAEFTAWVNNRMREIHGSPPLKAGASPSSLDDIANQPDKQKAVTELQTRVDDAFKEVFAQDGPKLARMYKFMNAVLKQGEVSKAEAVKNVRKVLLKLEGPDKYARSSGRQEAVYVLAAMGEFKLAQDVAGKIDIHYMKRSALQFIAHTMVAAGNKAKAVDVLKETLEIARAIDKENGGTFWEEKKIRGLCFLSRRFAEAGDKPTASAVLNEAIEMVKSVEGPKLNVLVGWRAIAQAYFVLGKKEDAFVSLKNALRIIPDIERSSLQTSYYCSIAECYSQFGDKEMASIMFKQAALTEATTANEDPLAEGKRDYQIVRAIARTGAFKEAVDKANTIEDVDGYNPPAGFRYDAFRYVANEMSMEPVPNKFELDRNARPVSVRRLKKEFTSEEKALAKKIFEGMQAK